MISEVRNEAEMSVIVNDLIKDIEEQKEVTKAFGEGIRRLEECQKELSKKVAALETRAANGLKEGMVPVKMDTVPVEAVLREGIALVREEVKKQHTVYNEPHYYSVFGNRVAAEHFSVVVNTVMKWVVILIGAFALISIVKFLIHYQ